MLFCISLNRDTQMDTGSEQQLPPASDNQKPHWTLLQQHAAEGLPSVEPGMPLMEVMAIIADYLRDNGFVQSLSYSRNERAIDCQFTTCPWAGDCPCAHRQGFTCHLLHQLMQTTLRQAGYPVEIGVALFPKATPEIAFCLHLRQSDN